MLYDHLNSQDKLAKLLKSLDKRLTSVETGAPGVMSWMDENGVETIIGELPDGTVGFKPFVNDTTPPPVPTIPQISITPGVINISWDGVFVDGADKPADFEYVNVLGYRNIGGNLDPVINLGLLRNSQEFIGVGADVIPVGQVWEFAFSSVDYNRNISEIGAHTAPVAQTSFNTDVLIAEAISSLSDGVSGAQSSADGKSTNYYQPTAPTGNLQIGDTWFDSANGYRVNTWTGSAWQTTQDSALAQQTADSKGRTYTQDVVPPVEARLPQNLWIDTSAGPGLYVTKYWNGTAWTALKDKDAKAAQDTADAKGETIYSDTEPVAAKRLAQNLWVDTTGGVNINKRWDGSAWVVVVDSRIPSTAAAVTAVDGRVTSVSAVADSKGITYTQNTVPPVSARLPQNLWIDTSLGLDKAITKYWNGTAWTALADKAATDAQTVADSKGETIFSSTAPAASKQLPQNLWVDTSGGINITKRWDTTSGTWIVSADSRIASTAAAVTAVDSRVDGVSAIVNVVKQDVIDAQDTADAKGVTLTQSTVPSVEFRSAQNLWIDTALGLDKAVTKYWNGTAWTAIADKAATDAQTTADAKGETIYSSTTPAASKQLPQNLWVDTTGGINITKRWDGSAWVVVADSRIASTAAAVTAVDSRVTSVSATADAKGVTYTQNVVPPVSARLPQNLWIDTSLGLNQAVTKYWDGTAWTAVSEKAAKDAQSAADAKGEVIYSSTAPAAAKQLTQNLWIDTTGGINIAKRWDGSGWVVTSDTRIDANAAAVTAVDSRVTAVSATADSKGKIFTQNTVPPVSERLAQNLWVDTSLGANQTVTKYWNGSAWTPVIDKVATDAATVAATKTKTYFQTAQPSNTGNTTGDMWFDTDDGNKAYVWNGTAWTVAQDSTISKSLFGTFTTDIDAQSPNKWLYTKYNVSNGGGAPSYLDIVGVSGTSSLVPDGTDLVKNVADQYIGQLRTVVNVVSTKTIAITATHDDGGRIYVDGVSVYTGATYSQNAAISFQLTAGWHVLDFLWSEAAGGDGWNTISPTIGSQVTSMYAPVSLSATTKAVADAQASANTAMSAQSYSNNASFDDWTSTFPTGYASWTGTPVKETAIYRRAPYAMRFNVPDATAQQGVQFSSILAHAANLEYFTVEVELYLVSGTLDGSGMILDWNYGAGTYFRQQINFVSAISGAITGKWYRLTQVLRRPTNATGTWTAMSGYLMGQWSGHGTGAAKNVIYDWFNVRPATNEEITAYGTPASITTVTNLANAKGEVIYSTTTPTAAQQLTQNLWIDTNAGVNLPKRWNGSSWVIVTDKTATDAAAAASAAQSTANTAVTNAATAQGKADSAYSIANGKNTAYYQATQPSGGTYIMGDTWFDTANDYRLSTYTGSAWQTTQDAIAAKTQAISAAATDATTKANNAQSAAIAAAATDATAKVATKNATYYQTAMPTGGTYKTGDLWFDTDDGNKIYAYNGTTFVVAQDAAIAAAQGTANTALTSANGKNKVYYQTAMPTGGTYILGDTWFDTDDGNKIYVHNGTTFVASQDAAIGTAQSAANAAQTTANTAVTTANSKTKTYFQTAQPGTSGNTTGDIWFDTDDGNKVYVWNGSAWTIAQDAAIAAAQTSANGKNTIFYQTAAPATTGRVTGDTWFDTDDGYKIYVWNGSAWTASQDAAIAAAQTTANTANTAAGTAQTTANSKTKTFIQGTAPTATTTGDIWIDTANGNVIKTWEGSSWITRADAAIAAAQTAANTAQTSANGKATVFYQTTAPSTSGRVTGDTWFDTANGYRISVWNGSAWTLSQDASIAAAQTSANTAQTAANAAQTTANSKVKTFVQGTSPTASTTGDIWIDTANGNVIKVWDGSAWVNRADTAIAAAQTAANNAQTSANGKNRIYYQTSMPSGGTYIAGDTWFDTDDGNKIYVHNGTTFTASQLGSNAIANLAITNAQIADTTIQNAKIANLDAAKITTGTLDANRIGANSITANKIFVGDFTNLAADGNFTDATKLSWTGSGSVMVSANQPNRLKIITAASGNNDQANVNIFQVEGGEQVYVDALVYGETTNVGGGSPNVHLAITMHDGTMQWPSVSLSRAAVQGAWTPLQGTITVPANGKTAKVELAVTYSADAVGNIYYFREVTVRRKSTGSLIVDGAIQAGSAIIATGAIGTAQIGNLAVGTAQIADTAITTAKIANLAVTNAQIADASIQSAKIANLDAGKITTGTLDANRIGADTITAVHIASDSITSNELAAGSITAAKGQISNLAVGTAQIQDTAITTAKIANLAVTNAQIADATIASAKISALDAGKITTGTLDANRIGADTITATHIASDAITANELAANSITAAKGQISDLAITTAKIADAQITNAKIANLAVDNAKIAEATIQYAKIGSVDAGTISVGTLSANRIGANTITSSKMLISDMEELIPNPLFHPNAEPVTSGSVVSSSSTPVSAGAPFPYVYQFSARDNHPFINTPNIAVKAGDQFYLEVWVASATAIRNFNLYMFRSMSPVGGLTAVDSVGNVAPTTTWTKVTWDYTVPADGYNYIKPVLQINNSGGETTAQMTWYATGWTMKRKNTGKLIVDGAIQAGSAIIADAAISNAKIADLNADKLTAGTVNAARLNAEDIRAKVIAATDINAVDIIAQGSLTSASGVFGTVDASVINAGTLAAARIGANSIDVSKLNVTLGGLNLVANSSFEVDSDANGLADSWSVSTRSTGDAGRVFTNSLVAGHFPGSTYAQKVVTTTATNTNSSSLQGTQLFSIAPGAVVTVSLYGRANSNQTFAIGMRCEDNAAAYIGEPTFNAAFTTTAQRFVGTLTIPAGTTKARVTITTPTSPANGSWFEADGVKVEIGDVVSAWSPMTQELLPGTIVANMISATAIDGKTITGATIQTIATANRGIKLTSTELAGYDNVGVKNFSLSSAGVLTLTGAINSGSTITGASITGSVVTGAGIATNATANRGVKLTDTGITTYDGSGNMTFKVDGTTGLVEAPGLKANSIVGTMIAANTISTTNLLVSDLSNNAENPSFESGDLRGWVVGGGWYVNTAGPQDGTYKALTQYTGVEQYLINNAQIYLKAGEQVRVKVYVYPDAPTSGTVFNVSLFNSVGGATENVTAPTMTNGSWNEYSVILTATTSGSKQLRLATLGTGSGYVRIDNVRMYKMGTGELIVDGAIDGKTITGALVQTETTANRGIKLTSTELAGYDGAGVKNLSLTSAGVLTLKGAIQSGSTITGATLTGAGIETTATAARGVKLASTGITTYDASGNMTFKVDAATGLVEAPGLKANTITGGMIASQTITVNNIKVADFTNLATIDEINGVTVSSYGQTQIVSGYNSLVTDSGSFFMFTDQRGPVPFKVGDKLYFEFTAKATSATTANFGIWTYDLLGGNLSNSTSAFNIGTTDTLVKGELPVTSIVANAKQFVLGLLSVANKGIQVKGVKVYKKYGGELIVDGAIDGKVITGATIQTETTASRGIKLTSTELAGYDGAGVKNFSLTSAGALTIIGAIKAGSSIEGATITGTGGLATSTGATSGVKMTNSGIVAYDGSNNMTFKVDAATGLVEAPGLKANSITSTMVAATAIDGKTITGATVQTTATASRGIKLTSTELAGYDNTGVKNFSLLTDGTLSIKGDITSGSTITGAIVTGGTVQSEATASRGIKMTSTELAGYDTIGTKNFSLTSAGALFLIGQIKSGSTIEGATLVAGGGGIQTTATASRGVKVTDTGIKAYDNAGNLTFQVDAATGIIDAPGLRANSITSTMVSATAIDGKTITGATIQTETTASRGIKLTSAELAGYDGAGVKNFSLATNGTLTIRGAIQSGSTIDGTTVTGSSGIQTSTGATSGVKMTNTGIKAWDGSNNLTFNLDATTGYLELPGLKANSISGDRLVSGSVTSEQVRVGDFTNHITNGFGELGAGKGFGTNLIYDTTDKPAELTGVFKSTAGQGTYAAPAILFDVTPNTEYITEIWLKASLPNSRIYIELRDQAGNLGVTSINTANGASEGGYALSDEIVPTVWTKYTIKSTTNSTTSRLKVGNIYFNHANGTERNAVVSVALGFRRRLAGSLIVDGGITTNHMTAGTINGGVLAAGSVTALEIASKAITADKMVITSTDNIVPEADFSAGLSQWGGVTTGWSVDATGSRSSLTALKVVNDATEQTKYSVMAIPVEAGSAFRIACWVKSSVTIPTGGIGLKVRTTTTAGATTITKVVATAASASAANTWTRLSTMYTMPAGAVKAEFGLYTEASFSTGNAWYDTYTVTRASDGTLVVDGAIDGKTITGALMQTEATALRGLKLDSTGLNAYNSTGANTFSLSATTGKAIMTGRILTGASGEPGLGMIPAAESYNGTQCGIFVTTNGSFPGGIGGMWVNDATTGIAERLQLRGHNYGDVEIQGQNLHVRQSGGRIGNFSNWALGDATNGSNYLPNLLIAGPSTGYLRLANAPTTSSSANLIIATSPEGVFYRVSSSIRYKADVQDWDTADRALQLRPRTWVDRKPLDNADPFKRYYGYIAEEVEEHFPEFVVYNDFDEPESVTYDRMPSPATIATLKVLNQKIADLEARLEAAGL